MSVGYFISPYVTDASTERVRRALAFQQASADVDADSGYWAESEQPDDQAIVRVRASDATLTSLGKSFQPVAAPEKIWLPLKDRWNKPLDVLAWEVMDDAGHDLLRSEVDALIAKADQQGYVRLDGVAWADAAPILAMLGAKGYPLNRVSTGTFPTTGIISSFTGADEDPLSEGGTWTNGSRANQRVSNTAGRSATGSTTYGFSAYNVSTFGPACEAYVTISTLPGNGNDVEVSARGSSTTINTSNNYSAVMLQAAGTDTPLIGRDDAGTFTQLGAAFSQDFAATNRFGLECVGSTISIYWDVGSGWVLGGSRTDSTYGAAGYLGMIIGLATARLDNFGGGTLIDTLVAQSWM